MLIDTHTHIHDAEFFKTESQRSSLYQEAVDSGVERLVCIGTDLDSSRQAVKFCQDKSGAYPVVGLHPHDADHSDEQISGLEKLLEDNDDIVAIGECGLDYYYSNSAVHQQHEGLIAQFELANKYKLPMVFHIRGSESNPDDAFSDFWQIYDKYKIPGVVHSFSAMQPQLDQILQRGLYVGINGIVTFAKDPKQRSTMLNVPLDNMVLETDSPFLTPVPERGKVNTSKNINLVLDFLDQNRPESREQLAEATTANAIKLFRI